MDNLITAVDQLLGRASGPLHFRLILQPVVASFLAIRAGVRDGREGKPAFFWTFLTDPEERRILLQSGWKDLAKILTIAVVLDVVYQVVVLKEISIVQTAIVATAVAIVPYILLRGPVSRAVGGQT